MPTAEQGAAQSNFKIAAPVQCDVDGIPKGRIAQELCSWRGLDRILAQDFLYL